MRRVRCQILCCVRRGGRTRTFVPTRCSPAKKDVIYCGAPSRRPLQFWCVCRGGFPRPPADFDIIYGTRLRRSLQDGFSNREEKRKIINKANRRFAVTQSRLLGILPKYKEFSLYGCYFQYFSILYTKNF